MDNDTLTRVAADFSKPAIEHIAKYLEKRDIALIKSVLDNINVLTEHNEALQVDNFVRGVELIGEMAWGIDIPSPITIAYAPSPGEEPVMVSVPPESMAPVFTAIYQKLKTSPEYRPFLKQKEEIAQLWAVVHKIAEHLNQLRKISATMLIKPSDSILEEFLEIINHTNEFADKYGERP